MKLQVGLVPSFGIIKLPRKAKNNKSVQWKENKKKPHQLMWSAKLKVGVKWREWINSSYSKLKTKFLMS